MQMMSSSELFNASAQGSSAFENSGKANGTSVSSTGHTLGSLRYAVMTGRIDVDKYEGVKNMAEAPKQGALNGWEGAPSSRGGQGGENAETLDAHGALEDRVAGLLLRVFNQQDVRRTVQRLPFDRRSAFSMAVARLGISFES